MNPNAQNRPTPLSSAYLGLLLLGLFLPLAIVARSGLVLPAEVTLAQGIQTQLVPALLPLFQAMHLLGQLWAVALYGAATVALLWASQHQREALLTLTGLLSAQSNTLVKALIARPRPDSSLLQIHAAVGNEYGFPSGDVQLFTVFFGLLFFFAPTLFPRQWAQRTLRGICTLLLLAIGAERVTLGVHWPTDVLGGYLLGGFIVWALLAWYQRARPA